VAVLGVFLYLAAVTLPLFESAKAAPVDLETSPWNGTVPRHFEVDEFQSIGWALADNGTLAVFRADNGTLLETKAVVEEGTITSAFFTLEEDTAILGFEDGSIRLGRIGFGTRFFEPEDVPPEELLRRSRAAWSSVLRRPNSACRQSNTCSTAPSQRAARLSHCWPIQKVLEVRDWPITRRTASPDWQLLPTSEIS
jgi:hypothetical protein